jgi:hypothetical protein
VLDPQLVEEVAAELGIAPGLIDKEWHVVRAIGVVSALDHGEARPVFSGCTSLSVGWGLIQRFSEDADFKVVMPSAANPSQGRARRREFRERVLAALAIAEFHPIGPVRKASRFFSADFAYPNTFDPATGFRPYLQIEMTSMGRRCLRSTARFARSSRAYKIASRRFWPSRALIRSRRPRTN